MKKMVALIVDDSRVVIERFKEILTELDNIGTICHACNYREGSRLLEEVKPNIILLDINLPDKSGIELLRHIQARHMDIRVIMISNSSTEHYKKLCAGLGAEHFFDKSNEFDLIPDIISGMEVT